MSEVSLQGLGEAGESPALSRNCNWRKWQVAGGKWQVSLEVNLQPATCNLSLRQKPGRPPLCARYHPSTERKAEDAVNTKRKPY
jgi:hypothetical protein